MSIEIVEMDPTDRRKFLNVLAQLEILIHQVDELEYSGEYDVNSTIYDNLDIVRNELLKKLIKFK